MEDNTTTITKEVESKEVLNTKPTIESHVFKVSARSIITLIVICTVCWMGLHLIEIKEPLYTLSVSIVSFYFGQNVKKIPTV